MNAQRWLALGIVVLIVACVISNSLWLPLFQGSDEPDEGATQTVVRLSTEAALSALTLMAEETEIAVPGGDATITPNPFVEQLMADLALTPVVGDEPYIIMAGSFVVIDAMHRGEGTASIYQVGDLRRVLRLDPFSVTTGPDLHVLLSQHSAPRTSSEALLPIYVDLGALQDTVGAQNYEIPPEVELLAQFQSVVIYSMSFNIIYSTATLEQVRGQQ